MIDYPSQASLIKKYDVPVPRYTSYPTVPHWDTSSFSVESWINSVRTVFNESNSQKGISLYLHLPFCESLCTYCACNKRITKNHGVEITYIRSLLKEWDHYLNIFGARPVIRELHLGGGTPTFFSPENLKWLVSYVLEAGNLHTDYEFSFEGHPNNTTYEHLETLYDLGFRRVSFGVQDLDPKVQKTINRIQPFENVERVTTESRRLGYTSISFDLIYGLPHQTPVTITHTINKVLQLRPDRVSFYSYAHVPWVSPGQRGYGEADLPTDVQKRNLYELGRDLFRSHGYEDVGMDHFALSHDALFRSQAHGTLHRNFMGYTTNSTDLLVGLGVSAISDAKYAYAQNLKKVEDYGEAIRDGKLAVFKGHVLSNEDMLARQTILEIACQGRITDATMMQFENEDMLRHVIEMVREGILRRINEGYQITETGRPFIRNVCSLFDLKLRSSATENNNSRFSKAI